MLRKNISRGDALLGGIRQLFVVWGIVACSVALGSRYGDGSIVAHRRQENASFPRELLFQQEVGQQGWECLEEGSAAGDLLWGSQGGEGSALGRKVGRWGGLPGQARGRRLKRASCLGLAAGGAGGVEAWALGTWEVGLGGGFGVAATV